MEDGGHGDRLGERFAVALAAKDVASLSSILAPDVTLRALTPSRVWEAHGVEETLGVLFENWFEEKDRIEELVAVRDSTVEDRGKVEYRIKIHNPDGQYLVEQVAYFDDDSSRITWMSILCSGYRAIAADEERGQTR